MAANLDGGKESDVQELRELLANGTDINFRDSEGWTPLINAAFAEDEEAVDFLLQHEDIDVNAFGKDGVTALMNAALRANAKIVKLLLEKEGINVGQKDNAGFTALDYVRGGRDILDEFEDEGIHQVDYGVSDDKKTIIELLKKAEKEEQPGVAQRVLNSAKALAKRASGRLSGSRSNKKEPESEVPPAESEEAAKDKKDEDKKKGKGVQKNRMRCFECRKKVGLTGLECQCGYVFCGKHNYPDAHDCDFDFKADARERYNLKHGGKGAVASKIKDGEKL